MLTSSLWWSILFELASCMRGFSCAQFIFSYMCIRCVILHPLPWDILFSLVPFLFLTHSSSTSMTFVGVALSVSLGRLTSSMCSGFYRNLYTLPGLHHWRKPNCLQILREVCALWAPPLLYARMLGSFCSHSYHEFQYVLVMSFQKTVQKTAGCPFS